MSYPGESSQHARDGRVRGITKEATSVPPEPPFATVHQLFAPHATGTSASHRALPSRTSAVAAPPRSRQRQSPLRQASRGRATPFVQYYCRPGVTGPEGPCRGGFRGSTCGCSSGTGGGPGCPCWRSDSASAHGSCAGRHRWRSRVRRRSRGRAPRHGGPRRPADQWEVALPGPPPGSTPAATSMSYVRCCSASRPE